MTKNLSNPLVLLDIRSNHNSPAVKIALYRLTVWLTWSCFVAAAFVLPAYADTQYPLGISNDPTRAQRPDKLQRVTPPKIGKGFELPPVPKEERTDKSGKTVSVNSVQFAGNTVIPTAELNAIAAPYLKRPLFASDIEELRQKLTIHYINKGYINSGAVINNQSVANGVLKINLIEGKLTKINLSGQGRLRDDYIIDRINIDDDEPLNINQLQDNYRLLLGDRLIEKLNGRLVQGSQLGEASLDVAVTRARPYQFYAGADNYQTPSIGGYTGRMGGWVDNLLTLGERIDGQFIVNDGALGYNTGIDLPISPYGTHFGFRFSDTFTNIVEPKLREANIKNNITGYEGTLTHPVYKTFADEMLLGLTFAVRKNHTTLLGECIPIGNVPCDTQATVLRLSQQYSHQGESNNLTFWSTFNVGLDALGATIGKPGEQTGEFFSWLGQSMFTQRVMDNGAAVVIKGNIQLSDRPLLNLERYSLGGVYTVRGYRENTYVRDNGFNVGIEFRYPLFTDFFTDNGSLYLVPFMDYGGVWDNPANNFANPPYDYLHSVGIGFNWQYKQLSTDFYWGRAIKSVNNPAIGSQVHDIQDDGIHFRVNMNAF